MSRQLTWNERMTLYRESREKTILKLRESVNDMSEPVFTAQERAMPGFREDEARERHFLFKDEERQLLREMESENLRK